MEPGLFVLTEACSLSILYNMGPQNAWGLSHNTNIERSNPDIINFLPLYYILSQRKIHKSILYLPHFNYVSNGTFSLKLVFAHVLFYPEKVLDEINPYELDKNTNFETIKFNSKNNSSEQWRKF